jgi:hypothetical protein
MRNYPSAGPDFARLQALAPKHGREGYTAAKPDLLEQWKVGALQHGKNWWAGDGSMILAVSELVAGRCS